jgi:hypothetical protein
MTEETLMKTIVNCETGEVQVLPFSQEEINQRLADQAEFETRMQERQEAIAAKEAIKSSAKTKLMAGLPLTAEEADVLVI